MTKEEEILRLFQQGHTARSIIDLGYSKSSVYRVQEVFRTTQGQVNVPVWTIENIVYNRGSPRYLPGDSVTINFDFRNASGRDFYLTRIGVQTEWMQRNNIWYSQDVKKIVEPGTTRHFATSFPIPNEVALGEYVLMFGVEGQYVPVLSYQDQQLTTTWSVPQILEVKYPDVGLKVFLSHSVADSYLVRQLEQHLSNYGIATVEAKNTFPTNNLVPVAKKMIEDCDIFIALLTESAAHYGSVIAETNYAIQMNKPRILLREQSVSVNTQQGWMTFSKYENPQTIFNKIMTAINQVRGNITTTNTAAAGAIGLALLAFLVGYGLARGR